MRREFGINEIQFYLIESNFIKKSIQRCVILGIDLTTGGTQFKVTDIITLHRVCRNSLNIEVYSKCDLKMRTRFCQFEYALLIDMAFKYIQIFHKASPAAAAAAFV